MASVRWAAVRERSIFTRPDGAVNLERTQDTGRQDAGGQRPPPPSHQMTPHISSRRSIMGRFGSLFKKSEKEKPEANPYAQQPSASQSSQYDQYAQHNAAQYNSNQSLPQPSLGAPSGLPSGPRPGGLPSRVAPGYGNEQSPPPAYSSGPAHPRGSPYSNTSSPSMGGGFSNEKFGAQDGVGKSRFEPATSPYNSPALASSQRQRGYGNLGDSSSGDLFANYGGPSKQTTSPGLGQTGASYDPSTQYGEEREMTEEEKEEALVNDTKQQILQTMGETNQIGSRAHARAIEANERMRLMNEQLLRQTDMLNNAEKNTFQAHSQVDVSSVNLDDLDAANTSMFNLVANSKGRIAARAEKKLTLQRQHQIMGEKTIQEEHDLERKWQAERQRLDAGRPKELLGASKKKTDFSQFEFEDDDGQQREYNEQYETIVDGLYEQAKGLRQNAEFQGFILNQQIKQIERITDNVCVVPLITHGKKPKNGSNSSPSDSRSEPATPLEQLSSSTPVSNGEAADPSGFMPSRPPAGDPQFFVARKALPLWTRQDEIRRVLRHKDVLVLVGETGSGKSTQVPQFLYQEKWCQRRRVKIKSSQGEGVQEVSVGGMIAITQPRRVAATTLAHRVSREAGTPLSGHKSGVDSNGPSSKGLVGYSVRFDHRVPAGTKIKFLTEGMLLQELLRDPHLRQYSAVIVDEIHERSVDVDLLSGFLKQIISGDKAGRGGIPLKVVIMSATANVEGIKQFFSTTEAGESDFRTDPASQSVSSVEYLQIEGRQFPVDIVHTPKPVPDVQEALIKTIFKLHTEEALSDKYGRKDILAFLTGQEEIDSAQKLIEEYASTLGPKLPKIRVFPLFGQLSMEAQHEAFQPIKGGHTRKVVLATNIAETSVTVPGVRYVIDCGKAKLKQFRARLGMESLLAKPISKSSAIQRAGRAGREGPGKCFRLYTQETYDTLYDRDLPEILRTDILSAILTMKARGVHDVLSFPLMDPPQIESVEKALLHLHILGALDDNGSITEVGRRMVQFPVSPPYARVLLAAADSKYDCLLEVIDIISCITAGEDIFLQLRTEEDKEQVEEYRKELFRREGDLLTYLTTMQLYAAENADRVKWCKDRKLNLRNMKQALHIRKQLRRLCVRQRMSEPPPPDPQPFSPVSPDQATSILKCFLAGFSIKTAILAPDNSYVTSHGKHVVAIHPASVLHGQKKEAIMFLEHVYTQKSYAKKVSAIQAVWIAEALEG
ncbi:P-loop containing nucleoside triphosphate hydrolase protein [Corynascus novoguineensis]|uniref:RNA helicase n=1 Tax=Corynascus novoguineensis TaxID=1126955 RepID=A0AAN7D1F2_9PEZI|nr:P-loop containing nucleoside triphosphate hydrolase protein [Corynascus novoguineensis]